MLSRPFAGNDYSRGRMIELIARYDGMHFLLTNPSPQKGAPRVTTSYSAVSGQPGFQVARHQAQESRGPIVEGFYTARAVVDPVGARFDSTLDPRVPPCRLERSYAIQAIHLGSRQLLPRRPRDAEPRFADCSGPLAAWGKYRWRLAEDPATAKRIGEYGRTGGFHLHGGGPPAPGTSGCIRLNDDFWNDLFRILEVHGKTLKRMALTVKYASRDTRTGPYG